MRKTRLVLIPGVKSLDTIGCLLLFLACPTIAFKGQENREVETICKAQNLKEFWVDSTWPGDTDNIGWARGYGGGNWPGKSQKQNTCNSRNTRSVVRSSRNDDRRVQERRDIARDYGTETRRIRLDNEIRDTTRVAQNRAANVGKMRDSRRFLVGRDEERRQDFRRVRDNRREFKSVDREIRNERASDSQRRPLAQDERATEIRTVTKREIIDARRNTRAPTQHDRARSVETRRMSTEPRISDDRSRSIEKMSVENRRLSQRRNSFVSSQSLERERRSERDLANRRDLRMSADRVRTAERSRDTLESRDGRRESTFSMRSLNRDIRSREAREDSQGFRRSARTNGRQTEVNEGRRTQSVGREMRERVEPSQRRSNEIRIRQETRIESRRDTENRRDSEISRQYVNRRMSATRELKDGRISRERDSGLFEGAAHEIRVTGRRRLENSDGLRRSAGIDREIRRMRISSDSTVTESQRDRRVDGQRDGDSRLTRSLERVRSADNRRVDSRRLQEERRNSRFSTRSLNRDVRSEREFTDSRNERLSAGFEPNQFPNREVRRLGRRADVRQETRIADRRNDVERDTRDVNRRISERLNRRIGDVERADISRERDGTQSRRLRVARSLQDVTRSDRQIQTAMNQRETTRVDNRRTREEPLSRIRGRTTERQILDSDQTRNSIRRNSREAENEREDIRRVRDDTRSQNRLLREAQDVHRFDRRTTSATSRRETARTDNRRSGYETLSRELARNNPDGIRDDSRSQFPSRQRRTADERRSVVYRNVELPRYETKEMRRLGAAMRRMDTAERDAETRRHLNDVSLKFESIRTFPKENRRSDRHRRAVDVERDVARFASKRLEDSRTNESFRRFPETNEPTLKSRLSNKWETNSGKTNKVARERDGVRSEKDHEYFYESPKNALASWLTADLRTDFNGIAETLMYGGIACFALFSNVNKKVIF